MGDSKGNGQGAPHGEPAPAAPRGAATPAPAAPGTPWQTILHETIAATVSVVLLFVAVWMIVRTFEGGAATFETEDKKALAQKESYERQKDIMLYGLALLGTVTGYYLGRVPAERRADAAQQAAVVSQRSEATARQDATVAQDKVVAAAGEVASARVEAEKVKGVAREAVRDAKVAVNAAAGQPVVRPTLGGNGGAASTISPELVAALAALEAADQTLASLR